MNDQPEGLRAHAVAVPAPTTKTAESVAGVGHIAQYDYFNPQPTRILYVRVWSNLSSAQRWRIACFKYTKPRKRRVSVPLVIPRLLPSASFERVKTDELMDCGALLDLGARLVEALFRWPQAVVHFDPKYPHRFDMTHDGAGPKLVEAFLMSELERTLKQLLPKRKEFTGYSVFVIRPKGDHVD